MFSGWVDVGVGVGGWVVEWVGLERDRDIDDNDDIDDDRGY